jgi:translation initiation factor IF-3
VPVPRRFDRRPPERDTTRINERIRVPEVRLIDDEGKQIGVLKTADALAFAQERDLDLVEVAPEARPPVCRVLDYSKYKYEQAQKLKQARKHQQQITIREIKFRPKIAEHDYDTKKHHVERFLRHKDKVKVTIMFRGREVTHPERGTAILDRLAEELSELGVVEQRPMQEGRNMTMMMAPSKAVLAGRIDVGESAGESTHDGDVASAALESAGARAAEAHAASAPQEPAAPAETPDEAASAPAETPAEASSAPAETPAEASSAPAETPAEQEPAAPAEPATEEPSAPAETPAEQEPAAPAEPATEEPSPAAESPAAHGGAAAASTTVP